MYKTCIKINVFYKRMVNLSYHSQLIHKKKKTVYDLKKNSFN